ncbi:MAG: GGDEF domain-containing protein [Desulfovibrio sp.]|nr:GGDEF domain-containing protein [Desulfovibrio sp.]
MLAHSDASRIGVRLDEGNETDQRLMQTIKQKEGQKFTLEFDEIRISLGEPMIAGWNLMLVLDKRKLYSSLQLVYFASLAFFLFVLGSCLVGLLYVIRKNELAWQLEEEIKAAASIYMSMYRIDCVSGSMVCVRDDADLARHVGVKDHNFKQFSKRLLERFAEEAFRDLLQAFLNVETLWERLTDMETITQEFRDFEKHWVRLRFIVISRAPSSLPQRVLLALESIDEDRRRQEHLRRLSETDLMTGVLNRGCGERLVREALLQGKRGLFCLMDADNFKIINDTFGHRVGDKFLIAMADCLKKSFRDTDVVFRLGGDEFCVFVEGVNDKDSACKIVQRFFASIKKINLPELAGREVTISVGATFYPTACPDSFENMYQRADQGTYESKKLPGNQLIFH